MTPHDEHQAPGPVRTCIGCRERAARSELLRVTVQLGSDGLATVVPDLVGSAPGRGAHVHPTERCFELAVRKRAFGRALRYDAGSGPALDLTLLTAQLLVEQLDFPDRSEPR